MAKQWIAVLLMAGAMWNAEAVDFNCSGRLPDMAGVRCDTLVGDLVTKRFKEKYPASTYQIVLMADSAYYDDGSMSGYVLAGLAPQAGDQYPDDPMVIQFREPQALKGQALFNREKALIRSAVNDLMRELGVVAMASKKK